MSLHPEITPDYVVTLDISEVGPLLGMPADVSYHDGVLTWRWTAQVIANNNVSVADTVEDTPVEAEPTPTKAPRKMKKADAPITTAPTPEQELAARWTTARGWWDRMSQIAPHLDPLFNALEQVGADPDPFMRAVNLTRARTTPADVEGWALVLPVDEATQQAAMATIHTAIWECWARLLLKTDWASLLRPCRDGATPADLPTVLASIPPMTATDTRDSLGTVLRQINEAPTAKARAQVIWDAISTPVTDPEPQDAQ